MSTKDQLVIGFFAVLGLALLPVGFAVSKTWTGTHTAFALAGVLLIGAIWANGHAAAHGVALHDRRTGTALPSVRVDVPPSTGYPVLDQLTAAKLRDLDSRSVERLARADLAMVGMEQREIPVRHWQDRAAAGWQDGAEL